MLYAPSPLYIYTSEGTYMSYSDTSNELDTSLWLQALKSFEDFVVIISKSHMNLSTVCVSVKYG